jgi:hypothetical protein
MNRVHMHPSPKDGVMDDVLLVVSSLVTAPLAGASCNEATLQNTQPTPMLAEDQAQVARQ